MVVISVVLAVIAAVLGHISAILLPGWMGFDPSVVDATSTSGMMAVMAGVIFAVVLFCAPRHGILVKKFRRLEVVEETEGGDQSYS